MLDTVDFNHVQHISFTQSRLTDAVSVILSELLSYEHPPNRRGLLLFYCCRLGEIIPTCSLKPGPKRFCKQLSERLFPSSTSKPVYKMPDYASVHKELQRSGVTLNLL